MSENSVAFSNNPDESDNVFHWRLLISDFHNKYAKVKNCSGSTLYLFVRQVPKANYACYSAIKTAVIRWQKDIAEIKQWVFTGGTCGKAYTECCQKGRMMPSGEINYAVSRCWHDHFIYDLLLHDTAMFSCVLKIKCLFDALRTDHAQLA